jgi:hypothetical protein
MAEADGKGQDAVTGGPSEPNKPSWLQRHFPQAKDLATVILSACALVLSLGALYTTYHQNKAANAVAVASIFTTLRAHYHRVDEELPRDFTDKTTLYAKDSNDWQKVRHYWSSAFDEWFVSSELQSGDVESLWDSYYADAIGRTIQYPAMRAVYCDLGYWKPGQTIARQKFHVAISKVFASLLQLPEPPPGATVCPFPIPASPAVNAPPAPPAHPSTAPSKSP